MRYYLLAAVAAAVIASPAAARDGTGYVGVDGGVLFPKDQTVFGSIDFTNTGVTDVARTDVGRVDYKTGYDLDFVGGYDFGMFRLEGELGYKRAKVKSFSVDTAFVTSLNGGAGTTFTTTDFDINRHTTVLSAMVNALADFGGNGGVGGYLGAGAGYADVKQFGDSHGKFAWQLLAGVYAPVSDNIELGLKYRYFRTGKVTFDEDEPFTGTGTCGQVACSGGTVFFDNNHRFSSHSLLASLRYNFGAPVAAALPPPPPPPPPPVVEAPATQTCPDGSVILATSMCPPPPPPPPPPPVERGERGR